MAANRPGLSAAAVALACLTEELIPRCVDGRITDAFLCHRGVGLLQRFEPEAEATAGWLGLGGWWGAGGAGGYLCHGGITGEKRVQTRSL